MSDMPEDALDLFYGILKALNDDFINAGQRSPIPMGAVALKYRLAKAERDDLRDKCSEAEKRIKHIEKEIAGKTDWQAAHEITSFYSSMFYLYRSGFFALLLGKDNPAIELCKTRVHETGYDSISSFFKTHEELRAEIDRLKSAYEGER